VILRCARLNFYCTAALREDATGGNAFSLIRDSDAFPWGLVSDSALVQVYRQRFTIGHHALVRIVNDTLAFRSWLATGTLRVDEIAFDWSIPSDDCCVYDVITDARFRGRGLYPEALAWTRGHGIAKGRVWVYCEHGNASSQRGIEKAGFALAGSSGALVMRGSAIARLGRVAGVTR
jgi:hypothetical protein